MSTIANHTIRLADLKWLADLACDIDEYGHASLAKSLHDLVQRVAGDDASAIYADDDGSQNSTMPQAERTKP